MYQLIDRETEECILKYKQGHYIAEYFDDQYIGHRLELIIGPTIQRKNILRKYIEGKLNSVVTFANDGIIDGLWYVYDRTDDSNTYYIAGADKKYLYFGQQAEQLGKYNWQYRFKRRRFSINFEEGV